METFVPISNKILAVGTVAIQLYVIIAAGALLLKKETYFLTRISKYALHIIFALTLGGLVASLYYSEIVGYPPCLLCLIQRAFMYPQVLIAGYGLYKKKRGVLPYHALLSFAGILVAIYHVYLDMGGSKFFECDSAGSCTARYVAEFGYITIPMMSLTLFAGILVTYFVSRKVSYEDRA